MHENPAFEVRPSLRDMNQLFFNMHGSQTTELSSFVQSHYQTRRLKQLAGKQRQNDGGGNRLLDYENSLFKSRHQSIPNHNYTPTMIQLSPERAVHSGQDNVDFSAQAYSKKKNLTRNLPIINHHTVRNKNITNIDGCPPKHRYKRALARLSPT